MRKRFELTKGRANSPEDTSDRSDGPDEKHQSHHVEQIHTNERIPGHPAYYEKNGLRTYGDDADHDHEPKMSFARIMSLIAMAFRKILFLDSRSFVTPG